MDGLRWLVVVAALVAALGCAGIGAAQIGP
jgi:hypothetical protein